jgi:hypothetical protein
VYVLSSDGKLLASQDLHNGYATYEGVLNFDNGVQAAPTVQDIDGDGKYEVLLNTTYYALCAYEINVEKAAAPVAYARTQTITVDGTPVTFQTYALKDANGNETNYVKARDLAWALNGTAAQFQVTWDGSVSLLSHTAYTPNGSEMSVPFSGDRPYQLSPSPTKVDGAAASLEALVLTDDSGNGYTYYKLRDLGAALGFTVDWTAADGILIRS